MNKKKIVCPNSNPRTTPENAGLWQIALVCAELDNRYGDCDNYGDVNIDVKDQVSHLFFNFLKYALNITLK